MRSSRGVQMVGWPKMPRSPQPRSSQRMITTLDGRVVAAGAAATKRAASSAGVHRQVVRTMTLARTAPTRGGAAGHRDLARSRPAAPLAPLRPREPAELAADLHQTVAHVRPHGRAGALGIAGGQGLREVGVEAGR